MPQLYGQLLTAARLNWEQKQQDSRIVFGAYTIADTWVLIKAEVAGIESQPTLTIEVSRECSQRYEAEAIIKILKQIVLEQSSSP